MPWPPFLVNVLRLPTIRLTPTTDCGSPVAESYQGCTEEGGFSAGLGWCRFAVVTKYRENFSLRFPHRKKMTASGVASKQKTRTMSAFLGGEGGGGSEIPENADILGFFCPRKFFSSPGLYTILTKIYKNSSISAN